jgi:hypothetical protein
MNAKYLGCRNGIDGFYIEGSKSGSPILGILNMRRIPKGQDVPIHKRYWWSPWEHLQTGGAEISDVDPTFIRLKKICMNARYRCAKG